MSDRRKKTKPARDAYGRFLSCGNLNGRPEKVNLIGVDASPYIFANSNLELNLNGETVTMTRQEALLNRLYQQAMKGDVRAIIHLDQKFDEANQTIADARMDLPDLLRQWQAAPPMSEEADARIEEIHRIINALQTLQTMLGIKNDKRRRKKKPRA
jgi:two-component sensor histidine kinase